MSKYSGFAALMAEADLRREKEVVKTCKRTNFTPEMKEIYFIGMLCGYAGYTDLSTLDQKYTSNPVFNDGYRCGKVRKLTKAPISEFKL